MPRSSRWLIAAGYLTPPTTLGLAWLFAPAGLGRLGGGALIAITLMVATVLAGLFLLAGVLTALEERVQARAQFRWYDYALVAAGLLPFVALGLTSLWPR